MGARRVVAAASACLALAACAPTVNGHPTTTATATGGGGDAQVALTSLLEAAPSGSRPWDTAWSAETTPTVEQFVDRVYASGDQANEAARLRSQGIVAIAHRTWVAPDSRQADVVLLRFASPLGAQTRLRTAVAAKSRSADITAFSVPNYPDAVGLYPPTIDDDGNYRAIVYAQKADIVMELFYYCPEPFVTTDAISWTIAQLQLLP